MSIYMTSYDKKAPYYADPADCYAREIEPFVEGHIYLRSLDGFPERPVKLIKKYPTYLLVETVPMPVMKGDDTLSMPYKMGVTSADLIRDITGNVDQVIAALLERPGWQGDSTTRKKNHKRYRFTGVDCTDDFSYHSYDPEGRFLWRGDIVV